MRQLKNGLMMHQILCGRIILYRLQNHWMLMEKRIERKLRNRISLCSCVIILSGMYVSYSEWIDYEIDTAISLGKPIIGVKPRGQERIPSKVSNNADVMVGWNSSSVVQAVRNYAL